MSLINFDKYPYLRVIGDEVVQPDETIADWIPPGWEPAFYELCDEINTLLKEYQLSPDCVTVCQIKEKFGELRFYTTLNLTDVDSRDLRKEIASKFSDLELKAMAKTSKICHNCGAPAQYRSTGWVLPCCPQCAAEEYDRLVKRHEETEQREGKKLDFAQRFTEIF